MSNYLNDRSGWKSWLFTLDHKRIGILYMAAMFAVFLLGGIFALLLRAEMLTPGETLMDAGTFNRIFTLHGAVMVFLFIIPAIPATLGNFVLPLMLGARGLVFPRVNLLSFWLYVFGALFAIFSLITSPVDTGWTFYAPYITARSCGLIHLMIAVALLGLSSILTGLNFVVSIHKLRPAWMTWFKMPLFAWSLYFTSIVQILTAPVLGIMLMLLIAERAVGIGILDPGLGGDPALFKQLFWLYAHPAVYITILPAMGIVSELISVFSRKPIFGYRGLVFSSAAIAFFTLFSWGRHLYTGGQSAMANVIFSLMALSLFIPSMIVVFSWVVTLYKGSIRLAAPMLYGLMFIFLFAIGEFTRLFLANIATSIPLQGTYFEVAHFHYLLVGGTLMAFIGGLHFWWPKMFGRMYSEKWAALAAFFIFVGINVTFFTQIVIGTRGMPRRYFNYPVEFTCENRLSSLGAYLLALGLVIMAAYLIRSLVAGKKAPDNPWGGASLDWSRCPSPPSVDNFESTPAEPAEPYDFRGLVFDSASESYRFSSGREG